MIFFGGGGGGVGSQNVLAANNKDVSQIKFDNS